MKKLMLIALSLHLVTIDASQSKRALCQPPKEIVELQEKIEHERQQKFLKSSSAALGIAAMGAYTIYALKQSSPPQPQKRFVSDAIAAASITTDLLKGVTGCIAGAYSLYKVRRWLYDGYVKEKEMQKELSALRKSLAESINSHAEIIKALGIKTEDLERVCKDHATDLNEGRECAQRTDSAIKLINQAINNHAEIIKRQLSNADPMFMQQESIIIPGRVQQHAAIPGNYALTNQLKNPAVIATQKIKSDCCCQ